MFTQPAEVVFRNLVNKLILIAYMFAQGSPGGAADVDVRYLENTFAYGTYFVDLFQFRCKSDTCKTNIHLLDYIPGAI